MADPYLYHFLPKDMEGEVLYPLNRLRQTHPELYQKKAEKYQGRMPLMAVEIPLLHVKWNDVLHLSPLCPDIVFAYLDRPGMPYLKIPASILKEKATVIYHYNRKEKSIVAVPEAERASQFSWFKNDCYEELHDLTLKQKQHFEDAQKEGKMVFLYLGVPHILTTDPIPLAACELVHP